MDTKWKKMYEAAKPFKMEERFPKESMPVEWQRLLNLPPEEYMSGYVWILPARWVYVLSGMQYLI